jgi:hypothetical protein
VANAGGKCVHKSNGVFCSSRVAYATRDPRSANGGARHAELMLVLICDEVVMAVVM